MKEFAVIGLGRFGGHLAEKLTKNGHTVLGIDISERRVQSLSEHLDHVVQTDATEERVLNRLGLESFDTVVVSIGGNVQASILITLMLKEMDVAHVVAKASSKLHQEALQRIGADQVIFPEKDVAMRLADSLGSSHILDILPLGEEVNVIELTPAGEWVGKSLKQLDFRGRYGVTVLGVRTGDRFQVSPGPDDVIREGEVLIAIGQTDDLKALQD